MQYIVTDTPKLSTSFTKAYCRRKNCLNIKSKYSVFCNQCLSEVALMNEQRINNAVRTTAERLPQGITWIYFIKVDGLEPIKIGRACNLQNRLTGLKTSCPTEIILLASFIAFEHVEKQLHELFKEHWVRGEWFNPEPEIMFLIDSINKGNIPAYLETPL